MSRHLVVIGGGPAGFFAAITAAAGDPAARITILEGGREVLRKVRVSGGGRCNISNACSEPRELAQRYPRGGRELLGPFHRFGPRQMIAWLAERGVAVKEEDHGRLFPVSDDARTIVTALRDTAAAAGIAIRCSCKVRGVHHTGSGFVLELDDATLTCDRLCLATGSDSGGRHLAGQLGLRLIPAVPSLFTFRVPAPGLAALSGIALEHARVALLGAARAAEGALLLTHHGLSGPAVLWCSAWAARELATLGYRDQLRIAWCAGRGPGDWAAWFASQRRSAGARQLGGQPPEGLPRRLWAWLLERAGLAADQRWSCLARDRAEALARELGACSLPLHGKVPFTEEFVTCGGIALDQVDFRSMALRPVPGLFACGELLDIDGLTGGYNFQACWTTGHHAGLGLGMGAER